MKRKRRLQDLENSELTIKEPDRKKQKTTNTCSETTNNNKNENNNKSTAQGSTLPQGSSLDVNYIIACNILVEHLPNDIIITLFQYVLPSKTNNDIINLMSHDYLQNGWNTNNSKIYDKPNIYIENVLPIPNQPSLIITIGAPGSGKSTYANVRNDNKNVFAADDYFDIFCSKQYKPELIGKAHEWCQSRVVDTICNKKKENVIVCNTNTNLFDINYYISFATFCKECHLCYKIVFAVMPEMDSDILFARNVHNVPKKKITKMCKRIRRMIAYGLCSANALKSIPKNRNFDYSFTTKVSKTVIFTGVFLEENERCLLREKFELISGKKLLGCLTDCHCTIVFKPSTDHVYELPFGKKVEMNVKAFVCHELVQCFVIEFVGDCGVKELINEGKTTHITMSFDEYNGKPVFSNSLIAFGNVCDIKEPFVVNGVVGAMYKGNKGVCLERDTDSMEQQVY